MSKRLMKERKKLESKPLEFVEAIETVHDDIFIWDVAMTGPADSPYAGGRFILRLEFPTQYPFKQPLMKFITKVYHPSVMRDTGEVCSAVVGQWGPTLDAGHCIMTVFTLLKDPHPDHPLEEEIAQQLTNDPKAFETTAKKWTKDFAN